MKPTSILVGPKLPAAGSPEFQDPPPLGGWASRTWIRGERITQPAIWKGSHVARCVYGGLANDHHGDFHHLFLVLGCSSKIGNTFTEISGQKTHGPGDLNLMFFQFVTFKKFPKLWRSRIPTFDQRVRRTHHPKKGHDSSQNCQGAPNRLRPATFSPRHWELNLR